MTKNEQNQSDEEKREKIAQQLALIEAALYVAGRPLDLRTLAGVIGSRSKKRVRKLATRLVENYQNLYEKHLA